MRCDWCGHQVPDDCGHSAAGEPLCPGCLDEADGDAMATLCCNGIGGVVLDSGLSRRDHPIWVRVLRRRR
jgi:hypothetical protein